MERRFIGAVRTGLACSPSRKRNNGCKCSIKRPRSRRAISLCRFVRPYTATDVLAYSHADYLRQLEHDRAGRANKTRIAASYETIAGITGSTETPGS